MDDLISRQAAIDGKICIQRSNGVEIYDDYAVPVEYLEQLPPSQPEQLGTNLAEVGTDTISRQAAIDALTKDKKALEHIINGMSGHEKEFDRFVGQRNQVECDIYAIKQLPPAQPEQRTGKWERHYSRPNVYADLCWHCSACGYHHADNWTNKFRYCPNCGARMNQSNKTCDCYSDGRCLGTKEIDPCSCSGNKSKCDFYEHVRQEGARHERSD